MNTPETMTKHDFSDLAPPDDLISGWQMSATGTQLKIDDRIRAFATDVAHWGAEQAAERLKGQWPTPITDRPPEEADGDCQGWVMILSDDVWRPWVWSQVGGQGWLHTPRWQPPAPPTLKEQALASLAEIRGKYPGYECSYLDVIQSALEADS